MPTQQNLPGADTYSQAERVARVFEKAKKAKKLSRNLVHLLKEPLPWRTGGDKESLCGRKKNVAVVTGDEYLAASAARRCLFCADRFRNGTRNWLTEVKNAILAAERLDLHYQPIGGPIIHEMEAIKELVERHREEFEQLRDAHAAEAVLQPQVGHEMVTAWAHLSDWTVQVNVNGLSTTMLPMKGSR
jgi:hypothetical protein